MGDRDEASAVSCTEIPNPAVISFKTSDIELGVLSTERSAAEHNRCIDPVPGHVGKSRLGLPDRAHLGTPAVHLVILAFAPRLVGDHPHRRAAAFEHNPVVLLAVLYLRGQFTKMPWQVFGPHLIRRIHVGVGVDDA